jgi:polar amino acid transport system substrate-binding protein
VEMVRSSGKLFAGVVLAVGSGTVGVLAVGAGISGAGATPTRAGSDRSTISKSCTGATLQKDLYKEGQLTVATDSPAYTPWFVNNDPSNGKGYESAVAYAVAAELGFSHHQVHWVIEPFNSSYAPGPKGFDFDINEISYTAARAEAVTFSTSYYDVTQALVALKSSAIVTKHSPAELRTYVYGDQVGTTSLAFIETSIRPATQPEVFDTLNDVKSALDTHRIEAFVTDTPTAQYIASSEIPGAVLVGQFTSSLEHYGLLFAKGDPLAVCTDEAITALERDGTLTKLQKLYLGIYQQVPTLRP